MATIIKKINNKKYSYKDKNRLKYSKISLKLQ